MSAWSSGYVLDVPYTNGFYRELSPAFLQFALLSQSIHPPQFGPDAAYCELGCGQGITTAVMAAANPQMRFWGFDFNPAQIANARRLVAEAGLSNVTFEDFSFEQVAGLPDDALPQFDVIALHGIYSWISPENRGFIVDIINRRLKPGGIVYISYNCLPGWATAAPLQRLIREHANRHPGRSDHQAKAAVDFARQVKEAGTVYFAANPTLAGRLEKLPEQNQAYLAHEYLNGHWHPMYHLDVARELEAARLTYVATATLVESRDNVSVQPAIRKMLEETSDRGWQETLRDFAANRQFRRDLFMRGANSISAIGLFNVLNGQSFALVVPRDTVKFEFQGPLGAVTGQETLYKSVVDALAERPHTVAELKALPVFAGRPASVLVEVLMMLVHGGSIASAPHDPQGPAAKTARAFNQAIIQRALNGETINYIAAPAIGSAISVGFTDLLVLHALFQTPQVTIEEIVTEGWAMMARTGQRLLKAGKALQTPEENQQELAAQIEVTVRTRLPVWRQLGVV